MDIDIPDFVRTEDEEPKYEYTDYEKAYEALQASIADAEADYGEDLDIDVFSDVLDNFTRDCSPEVARELWRTQLGIEVTYPGVVVRLIGEDGNGFSIIARTFSAIRRRYGQEEAKKWRKEALEVGSYDELLQLVMKTVEVL